MAERQSALTPTDGVLEISTVDAQKAWAAVLDLAADGVFVFLTQYGRRRVAVVSYTLGERIAEKNNRATVVVGVSEARNTLPDVIDACHRGRITLVKRRGAPLAAIAPTGQAELATRDATREVA